MSRAVGPVAPARPMVSLHQPADEAIHAFLDRQRPQPFSYPGVGSSRHVPPAGYVVDHRRVCLGTGQRTFEAACASLRRWQMFQVGWVQLCWPTTGYRARCRRRHPGVVGRSVVPECLPDCLRAGRDQPRTPLWLCLRHPAGACRAWGGALQHCVAQR